MSDNQQQEKSTPVAKYAFSSFPLYEHKTPEFKEIQGYKYYRYGDDNSYPDYLIYLYNRSSVHNAILDGKVRFILGNGWTTQDAQLQKFLKSVNKEDSLDELSQKTILDRRIFGGYALKITWFGKKISTITHIPFQKIRVSVPSEEYPNRVYFHSNEWTRIESTKAKYKASQKIPEDVRVFKPFNPSEPIGEQLLYVCDYRPQSTIYPLPEYVPCNAAIETDIEIDNFHLNNIKTGFAAGKMLTLKNGVPDDEEKAKIEKNIKSKVAGTDNAGEILINFADPNESAVEITDLRSNDLDKQYEQLAKDTRDKIFIGHGVTSPMLFGVKTEGQLGGRNELDLAWQIMNINYIEPKRKQFENEINWLFSVGGYSGTMELQPMSRLGIEFSEATVVSLIPQDQLRQMLADQLGIKIQVPQTPAPVQMDKDNFNLDDILLKKFEMDYTPLDGLEFADDEDERSLLDYLKKNKNEKIDLVKISKKLGIDAKAVLEKLIEKNLIAAKIISEDNVQIENIPETKPVEPEGYQIVTMYEYAWVDPSLATNKTDGIDKSRDFCQRLLKLGGTWTREQIDAMNNEMKDFNIDVWKYRGGWMTIPNTDGQVHTPSCRHWWRARFVKKPL